MRILFSNRYARPDASDRANYASVTRDARIGMMTGQTETPQPGYLAETRVLSGMRASGNLHLGHYFGALKNWVAMQQEYQCFYFVADWHGLTTHYASPEVVQD